MRFNRFLCSWELCFSTSRDVADLRSSGKSLWGPAHFLESWEVRQRQIWESGLGFHARLHSCIHKGRGSCLIRGLDAWSAQVREGYDEGSGARMGKDVRSRGDREESVDRVLSSDGGMDFFLPRLEPIDTRRWWVING